MTQMTGESVIIYLLNGYGMCLFITDVYCMPSNMG